MFILFFASSALVSVSTMPGWLQPFARNQPATVFVVFLVVSLSLYRKANA